ncbi:hypothetical protein EGT29_11750 [Pigmentiphaga sp. H8]|uniref:hypothetical protein n=1 Tax=Pigmentiphaga sp. H8 TaxID=2488560 RepID=UPI000F5B45CD|nr:hypothetical protein [Pigmentiphaga sp. H8]AZG08474.1 hypothetical protein EGT29_11750 [Pigmentiphaga sp. H8]
MPDVSEDPRVEPGIYGKGEAEKMLWLASAYAQGAEVLVNSMLDDQYQADHAQWLVVSHLCRHALELYLKGCIGIATGAIPRSTHRIDQLLKDYNKHYCDSFYIFNFLVEDWVYRDTDLFPETLEELRRTHDQRYRYISDKNGIDFVGFSDFNLREKSDAVKRFASDVNVRAFFVGEYGVKAAVILKKSEA